MAHRIRSTVAPVAILLGAALSACAPHTGPAAPEPLRTAGLDALVDSITATPPLHRTHWGIVVHDPGRGAVYALNPERNFVPASNMKLVAGAVALAELGPDYRYSTELAATGPFPGDTAASFLLVRGRGDPTLSARFHGGLFAALDSLADSVTATGIRRFRDGLIVDATWLADAPLHFAWFLGNLPSRFAAATAALGIEEATLLVVLRAGTVEGDPVRFELLPFPAVAELDVRMVTGPAGSRRELSTERRLPGDTLVVRGSLPLGARPDTVVLAAPDPDALAARALAAALEQRGVRLDGPARVVRDSAELAGLLADGPPAWIRTWRSPPLAEIVSGLMIPSQNWITEQVVKTVGAEREGEASWSAGLDVHTRYLVEQVGLDSSAFFLRDGSGLSNQNLLTPAGIVALLEHARGQPWFPAFLASLPRPGQEGGTLSGRLRGLEDRVAAKTGTVTHVNGLSGYILTASGRELSFSILTNATGASAGAVRDAMDRVVREIASW